jgi:hypothetical protein
MFWSIIKFVVCSLVPIPVNPSICRNKNLWTLTCDGFTTPFAIMYESVKNFTQYKLEAQD